MAQFGYFLNVLFQRQENTGVWSTSSSHNASYNLVTIANPLFDTES